MATYVPNPSDPTQPTEDKFVESAAAEFRALKQRVLDVDEIESRTVRAPVGETLSVLASVDVRANKLLGFDSDGNPSPVVPASGSALDLALALANSADSSLGDALIGVRNTGVGAVARTQHDKNAELLHVGDFGVLGNTGSVDESVAILAAINASILKGVELVFDGTKSYTINVALMTIPAGARLRTNGAVFNLAFTTTSNAAAVAFGAGCQVDEFNASVPTGVRRDRCVDIAGDNCSFGAIRITSADIQVTADTNDFGVRVLNGTGVHIGRVEVTNYDRAVTVGGTKNSFIGGVFVTGYVRGLWVYDNIALYVGPSLIKTRSPNASNLPGHNAIIMSCNSTDAQRNVTIESPTLEDAGEHALRIGGDAQQSNILIRGLRAYNAGNCGIKLLGTDDTAPTTKNRNIVIDSPIIEDCGTSASTVTNRCGILIEHAIGVQVVSPIIKTRSNAFSCGIGISINGGSYVHISNPIIEKASNEGLLVDNRTVLATNDHITVNGGRCVSCGTDGIRVNTADTQANNFIAFEAVELMLNAGLGFRVTTVGTGNMTHLIMRVYTQLNTGGFGASDTIRTVLMGYGAVGATPLSGIVAANSSTWMDGLTLNIRKAGAWVAL